MLVKIKPILARLESSMERYDLCEKMVLLPGAKASQIENQAAKTLNLVVGYNGSPNSHAALDIALLIAHQTRVATSKQVNVQVVYVIDKATSSADLDADGNSINWMPLKMASLATSRLATSVLTHPKDRAIATLQLDRLQTAFCQTNPFEKAEHILWQARYLVEEWSDNFTAHLRFGCTATELKKVVESEAADILFLGCNSVHHPLVEKLGSDFPTPLLGIPASIDA